MHVTLSDDDDAETVVREVFALTREALTPDTLGLGLAEGKDLLAAVQDTCPDCARPYRHKDKHTIVVRSLFGTLRLDSPRWWHCPCHVHPARTFSPLAALLPERTTPELSYLQARFAGLVSYGASASLLSKLLPLGRPLHATALRFDVHATAQRLEDELGDEHSSFIDTCPRDREELPRPKLPLVVGLDGGYVHWKTAAEVGLTVADTVITNDVEAARRFVDNALTTAPHQPEAVGHAAYQRI